MTKEKGILWLIILILSSLLAGMLWKEYHQSRSDFYQTAFSVPTKALHVPTKKVTPEEITLTETYLGSVAAIHSVPVQSYLSGFIEDIFVEGGQFVKKGDLMFVLQQESYQAAKDQARAQLDQAKATLTNASTYLKRIQNTSAQAVSQTDFDNATASFLSAEANVKAAEAAVKTADVNYGYTEIKAPIDGVVGNVFVTKGDYVSPSSEPLVTIVQYTPIRVIFSIPFADYAEWGGNAFYDWRMRLRLSDRMLYPTDGTVRFSDNQVNADTASVKVYSDFENPDKVLLPNAFVTVLMEKKILGMRLNKGWVTLNPSGAFIFILKDGRIQKQPIQIEATEGDDFVITKDLPENYIVITGQVSSHQVGSVAVSSDSDMTDSKGE